MEHGAYFALNFDLMSFDDALRASQQRQTPLPSIRKVFSPFSTAAPPSLHQAVAPQKSGTSIRLPSLTEMIANMPPGSMQTSHSIIQRPKAMRVGMAQPVRPSSILVPGSVPMYAVCCRTVSPSWHSLSTYGGSVCCSQCFLGIQTNQQQRVLPPLSAMVTRMELTVPSTPSPSALTSPIAVVSSTPTPQQRQPQREQNPSPTSDSSSNQSTSPRTSPHSVGRRPINHRQCVNCGVTESPIWRRDRETQECLCNACGLHQRLHAEARTRRGIGPPRRSGVHRTAKSADPSVANILPFVKLTLLGPRRQIQRVSYKSSPEKSP